MHCGSRLMMCATSQLIMARAEHHREAREREASCVKMVIGSAACFVVFARSLSTSAGSELQYHPMHALAHAVWMAIDLAARLEVQPRSSLAVQRQDARTTRYQEVVQLKSSWLTRMQMNQQLDTDGHLTTPIALCYHWPACMHARPAR